MSIIRHPIWQYGYFVNDIDEAEWRYKASGGYNGEFIDDIYGTGGYDPNG